jgi:hypothetical protein
MPRLRLTVSKEKWSTPAANTSTLVLSQQNTTLDAEASDDQDEIGNIQPAHIRSIIAYNAESRVETMGRP